MKEEFSPLSSVDNQALEGRIVAWVWNEAPSDEAQELAALCQARPDLENFRQEIISLRDLLQEDADVVQDWVLPPAKRRPIEALIQQESGESSQKAGAGRTRNRSRWLVPASLGAAACWVLASGFWYLLGSGEPLSFAPSPSERSQVNLSLAVRPAEKASPAPFFDESGPVAVGEFHHEPILPPQTPIASLSLAESPFEALRAPDTKPDQAAAFTSKPAPGRFSARLKTRGRPQLAAYLSAGEIATSEKPFSTFSLPVVDTSFEFASVALQQRVRPAAKSIRVEEFYNAFHYEEASSPEGEPADCLIETTPHPLVPSRHVVRVTFKVNPASGTSGKLQVQFDPTKVSRYKLLGFNSSSGDPTSSPFHKRPEPPSIEGPGTALYQIETIPNTSGDLGTVNLRLISPVTNSPQDRAWAIPSPAPGISFEEATPAMKLAVLSMLTAEKLKGGDLGDAIDFSEFSAELSEIKHRYRNNTEVKKWVDMVEKLQ